MSKQTSRIFQEMPLIERLLHQSISEYDPTCDDAIDETMKELLHREVPERADSFVTSLYAIAQDMTFSDWQDFWLDMGIRIYNAEEEFNDNGLDGFNGLLPTADFADDADFTDESEDDYELHELDELLPTADFADDADFTDESDD